MGLAEYPRKSESSEAWLKDIGMLGAGAVDDEQKQH